MSQTSILVNTPGDPGHSDAQDWASIFNALIGSQSGVIKGYKNELSIAKIDDNTFRLADGIYSLQGHMLKVDESTTLDLTIDSGTLGMSRMDYIIAEYQRNELGDDILEFKVLKGTSSTETVPSGPELIQGELTEGAALRQEVLYRILVSGTSAGVVSESRTMIGNLSDMNTLSDRINSISDIVRGGSVSVEINGGSETIQGNTWYKGSVNVVFDSPMAKTPRIATTVKSSGPMYASASVTNVTVNGFTINLHRINTVATSVDWVATSIY